MLHYQDFLASKRITAQPVGFDISLDTLNPALKRFQSVIVRWALRRGRAAIFSRYGTGKTLMQLEWAHQVCVRTGGNVLILAPLAVAQQTQREGEKFGITVTVCRSQADIQPGINVTNYEKLHHFETETFAGIVLDESGILKSFDGKTRTAIIEAFARTPYRLACTATPSPNDYTELGNHAQFLGILSYNEMLSTFFAHDYSHKVGSLAEWVLKPWGAELFWPWVCSWAVMLRTPSDLGYSDDGYTLPPLHLHQITVEADAAEGYLVPVEATTMTERRQARRESLQERVQAAADLVNSQPDQQWVCWCNLNLESTALTKAIPGAVEVTGSDSQEHKERTALDFVDGKIRVIVSKPAIYGFGLNFQNCARTCYVGLSDSFEQLDQSLHRFHRYGQTREVHAYIITGEREGAIVRNIERKRADHERMADQMVKHMRSAMQINVTGTDRQTARYTTGHSSGHGWDLYLGDCVERLAELPDEIADYWVFSPPFQTLFVYSASDRDMGNSKDADEFTEHYRYLIREQYRLTKPGRLLSFHCMLLPSSKQHDGVIGLRDFRGDLIRLYKEAGFIHHSEAVIWKDPVQAMQRTKALGLLHQQVCKDSAMSRQGIPDYVITMRKPGINLSPVRNQDNPRYRFTRYAGTQPPHPSEYAGERDPEYAYSIAVWQRYASPVWMDIDASKTLQYRNAREKDEEPHICPLQLQVIERCLHLWTNPGDLVLSPFAGIGSEGYVALELGRRFAGVELKPSYFQTAVRNLRQAEQDAAQTTLLDLIEEAEAA